MQFHLQMAEVQHIWFTFINYKKISMYTKCYIKTKIWECYELLKHTAINCNSSDMEKKLWLFSNHINEFLNKLNALKNKTKKPHCIY